MDSYMNIFSSSQTTDVPFPFTEPFSQPSTETSARIQKEKHSDSFIKATWDTKCSEIFIRLCVGEVTAGNRPGSHFNKTGWDNLVKKFGAATNRKYSKVQLKNKWDSLKKEFSQWKSLTRGETGLGWDHEKGTVTATEEWWSRKIQANPNATKFRLKGPLLVYDQETLFSDVVATGNSAWTPSSGLLPPHMQDSSDDETPIETPLGEPIDTESTPTADPVQRTHAEGGPSATKNKQRNGAEEFLARIRHKKAKKVSTAAKIAKSLERMVDNMEQDTVAASRVPADASRQYSISACIEIIENMDGIENGDDLWLCSTGLMLKPAIRELFLALKTNESRLRWLRGQMNRNMARAAPSNPTSQYPRGDYRHDDQF
ncbi:hypothetical protein ACJIZ3_006094 [Penstemon smallii]|uniref:Myb/SANT-like domain-containing protein n=1 Tax=Penstemon smallii TaxID=265156 RepID=A0ABD3S6P1_9LAMI